MLLLWILLGLILGAIILIALSIARFAMPLEPALLPGEISTARDPAYFALQMRIFEANGFGHMGDFVWHDGMSTTVMRLFLEHTLDSYGWAVEETVAGVDGAKRSVSVLTEFTDGTLADTTSSGPSNLAIPTWFLRESVESETERLLCRHRERRLSLAGQGLEVRLVRPEELLAVVCRNERRLGEYQVQKGRMRLVDGKLRFSRGSVARLVFLGLGRMLGKPFRREPS